MSEKLGESRAALRLRLQLRLLTAIRNTPDRTASIDAVGNLDSTFADGGRWRGAGVLELATAGLIKPVNAINSKRVGRKRGLCRLWRGVDDAATDVRIASIKSRLEVVEAGEPRQLSLPFTE